MFLRRDNINVFYVDFRDKGLKENLCRLVSSKKPTTVFHDIIACVNKYYESNTCVHFFAYITEVSGGLPC